MQKCIKLSRSDASRSFCKWGLATFHLLCFAFHRAVSATGLSPLSSLNAHIVKILERGGFFPVDIYLEESARAAAMTPPRLCLPVFLITNWLRLGSITSWNFWPTPRMYLMKYCSHSLVMRFVDLSELVSRGSTLPKMTCVNSYLFVRDLERKEIEWYLHVATSRSPCS